jgi:CAAX protease family protein
MDPNRNSSVCPADETAIKIAATTDIACWRCAKLLAAGTSACPYCHAQVDRRTQRQVPRVARSPIQTLMWIYAGLLVTGVLYGWSVDFGLGSIGFKEARERAQWFQVTVEIINAFLVLGAVCILNSTIRSIRWPRPISKTVVSLLAPATLLLMLVLNLGYHALLNRLLPRLEAARAEDITWLRLLTLCVQPALVEELFFRYVALGTLRTALGTHAAVLVSAVMFAMAHLFALPSIPLLFLLGICLGYARLYSGGLAIPMLLHFFHNLSVLLVESHLL